MWLLTAQTVFFIIRPSFINFVQGCVEKRGNWLCIKLRELERLGLKF